MNALNDRVRKFVADTINRLNNALVSSYFAKLLPQVFDVRINRPISAVAAVLR